MSLGFIAYFTSKHIPCPSNTILFDANFGSSSLGVEIAHSVRSSRCHNGENVLGGAGSERSQNLRTLLILENNNYSRAVIRLELLLLPIGGFGSESCIIFLKRRVAPFYLQLINLTGDAIHPNC